MLESTATPTNDERGRGGRRLGHEPFQRSCVVPNGMEGSRNVALLEITLAKHEVEYEWSFTYPGLYAHSE